MIKIAYDSVTTWVPLLRETLQREGQFCLQMEGHSMSPTLLPGCELEVVPLPERVQLGQLIVFAGSENLVVHRLVHYQKGRWITQGDGCLTPDPPFEPEQALGIVLAAYQDKRPCWPSRLEKIKRLFWISRYHGLRLKRVSRRFLSSS